ncbi:hypothetical protein DL89DRAFT_91053 [Linderina pennispora]|uniref:Uncharacterized protein n=1 Tax=Linderina pennispora TaxID=61395 RepID=A0A1Y1WI97_9FUNG|nr:uncharacterized protein DL89DRAFT_91053 [Linderina pennispora]ORX73301.1 hypothetical protein DL89DRAFT_91053 [Linderina pennispora]
MRRCRRKNNADETQYRFVATPYAPLHDDLSGPVFKKREKSYHLQPVAIKNFYLSLGQTRWKISISGSQPRQPSVAAGHTSLTISPAVFSVGDPKHIGYASFYSPGPRCSG